jgi:tetraacyldisaccharide-1-P 4'-kinase
VFRLVEPRAFSDHHAYGSAELRELAQCAREAGADALLTTEKDWARLGPVVESAGPRPPIWRAVLRLHPARGGEALEDRVRRTLEPSAAPHHEPRESAHPWNT